MNEEKKLVPKLRFPEFRGAREWEPKRLADTCLLITNGKANAQDHEDDGEYPLFDRSAVIKKSSEFMFDAEAVILPGEGMRFVPKYFQGKFNLHQRAYALMRHQGDGRFVYYSLDYLQELLAKKAVKSTVLSLRLPIVQDFVIGCPKSAEQQKIADCLSSLDELIAAQARKVDALKTHKKGLMQQLFPREGETQPRLRFPEFRDAGEWVNEPLGELGEVITGKTPSTKESELWGGDILFITPTDISEDEKYQQATARKVVETKSTKVLPTGSIVYTCIASIGKMALTVGPSITNQQINAVVPNKKTAGEFIYYALLNLTPWIKTIPASSTLPIINKTEFSKIVIGYSEDKDEQQRIAACLTSLDTLITTATQELETLKTHKKGLMQQLFPSAEAVQA